MARIKSGIPFGYRSGKSFLHRFPAGLKLLAVLALSITAYSSRPGLLVSALLVCAISLAARIRPWELLRGSRPLLALTLFMLVFSSLDPDAPFFVSREGCIVGLVLGGRIFVSFAAASLLFAVTTMRELRRSLEVVEKTLTIFVLKRATPPRVSLGISLMLGFIPRFFEQWETMNLAFDARSGKRGLRRLTVLVPLVTERMMEAAAETAFALEARGL